MIGPLFNLVGCDTLPIGLGGSALVGAAIWGQHLYNYWKPRKIGVYGPTLVGKTTLDRYMTTPGEMEGIPEDMRTTHPKRLLQSGYVLPRPTRKRVRWKGERRVIHSADIGGQQRFWNLWIDDMVDRQCEIIVFMLDERALNGGSDAVDCIGGFKFLTDTIINQRWSYRRLWTRLKGKRYKPRIVIVVANKADVWWDEQANILWQQQRLREHRIFDSLRPAMVELQKAGVPCRVSMMATRIGWNVETTLIEMLSW